MPINPKIKQIYDTLKEGGADVGSEKEFNDYFLAKGKNGYNNRKEVFNTLKEGGADTGKSYEEFAGWLGLHAVKPKSSTPQHTVQATKPTSARPVRTQPTRQQKPKDRPMTAAEKASITNKGTIDIKGQESTAMFGKATSRLENSGTINLKSGKNVIGIIIAIILLAMSIYGIIFNIPLSQVQALIESKFN
mgnify:CR=1 FL=1